MMTFDPNVKGQLYAVAYGYEKAYVSSDNGKKWRVAIDFSKYYEGTGIVNSIRELIPGKNPDILFVKPFSNMPEGQGIFSVNHKTGEIKHYNMPQTGYADSWIASFDVFDKEGNVVIADVNYRIDMTNIYSMVFITDDGGENWTPVYKHWENDYVYPGRVAFSPDNSSKLYIFRGNGPSGVYGGVYISEDSGKTWHETLSGYSLGTYAFNPKNPNEIYVGTCSMFDFEAVFRSNDGGETWTELELDYTPFIMDYIIDIAYDPTDPNNVFIVEENQIFSTADNFTTYLNVAPDSYYWGTTVSVNPFNSDDVVIGVDMNGIMRSNTRMQTYEMNYNYQVDAYCSDVAANTTKIYALRDGRLQQVGTDGTVGESYTAIFADAADDNSVFAYDSKADRLDRITFGGDVVTVCTGKGKPAGITYAGASGKYFAALGGRAYVVDMSGTPALADAGVGEVVSVAADGNVCYAATSGRVMKSTDGGSSWSNLAPISGSKGIKSISADGVLIALDNSGLYIFDEAAAEWNKVNNIGGVPTYAAIKGNTIVIREPRPNGLVAIRYSQDKGKNWMKAGEKEFEYCHADNLVFAPGTSGEVNVYLASSDMGLLTYRADYEPTVDPGPVPTENADVRMLAAEVTSEGTCVLSWVSPEGHYSATYNVYRDYVKVADGISNREFVDVNLPIGDHIWRVAAVYDGEETEGAEISATFTGLNAPVNNAGIVIDNLVNGNAVAILSWDLPQNYDKCRYNIYRDGNIVARDHQITTYTDRGLTAGLHNWSITAVYGGDESTRVNLSTNVVNNCAPVRDLEGYFDLDERQVVLDWNAPGDLPLGWMSLCGEPADAYGPTEVNRYDIVIANRWTADEIKALGLVGAFISDMAFVPMSSRARYFAHIWIGTDEAGQPVDDYSLGNLSGLKTELGDWNVIKCNNTIEIPEGKDVWVGIGVQYAGKESPLGIDGEELIKGKNYIRDWFNSPFSFYEDYDADAKGNFCLGLRMRNKDGEPIALGRTIDKAKAKTIYEVTRDGSVVATTSGCSYSEGGLEERNFSYGVRAIHGEKGSAPEVSVDVYAGNKCPQPSNLSVTEKDGNVQLEWEVAAPQLVSVPLYEEQFDGLDIPSDWTLINNDGDEVNWVVQHYLGADGEPEPNGFLFSDMYYWGEDGSYKILSPDNWIVSPEIDITGVNAKLIFYVSCQGMYNNQSYYEVLVSTGGIDPEDFTPIIAETLDLDQMKWLKKIVDMSSYHGKIRIALRHRNDSDQNCMGLYFDNVTMTQEVDKARRYNIYRDGMPLAAGVADLAFTDFNCLNGEHTWVVTTICDEFECESDPLSVTATITDAGIENVSVTQDAIYYDKRHHSIVVYGNTGSDNVEIFDVAGNFVTSAKKSDSGKTVVYTYSYHPGVYIVRCGSAQAKIIVD